MAEELIHGFTGGLNKDLATSLVQADSYIDANNIRIVTQEGQSSGILMNILGNELSFSIPDILEDVEKAIPASNNLQVIGWTTIRDTIVLFTCPEVANGTGQIWTVDYDSVTQTTPGPVLKYNQLLNFDSKHPIQAIGRYETTIIQRVYWTDNYNPPRTINLADPDVLNTDLDVINLSSSTKLNIPILDKIVTSGGNLLAGSYQYTYRLKKLNGTYSVFAPLSNPINIVSSSESTSTFQNYEGSNINTNTGKSIVYTIENEDDSYEYIEHVFIFKDTYNAFPIIYSFSEDNSIVGTITVTHSNNTSSNFIPITLEELLISTQNDFQKVKTIATKDNMLFFGNTKSENFKVVYDARAYRFNNSSLCKLEGTGALGTGLETIFFSGTATLNTINTEHDCINPFNVPNPGVGDQFKFQANGTTLGGEGINIKYEFTYTEGIADNNTLTLKSASPFFVGDLQNTSEYLNIPGQNYPQNNFYSNLKSPYYSNIYTGYTRGEIYRFGIVFFNKSGKSSYVNWIGDIKFPEHSDTIGLMGSNGGSPLKTTVRQLGIKFIVTIPTNIKNTCTGYSIVRVERTDENKTRLGTGVIGGLKVENGVLVNRTVDAPLDTSGDPNVGKVITLDGPAFHFRDIGYKNGDYLKTIGKVTTTAGLLFKDYGNRQRYVKAASIGTNPYPSTKFLIQKYTFVYEGNGSGVAQDITNGLNYNFVNMGDYDFATSMYSSAGGRTNLLVLDTALLSDPTDDYQALIYVSYNRDLNNQYGGNTFNSRVNNTYISCNHYFPMSKTSALGYDVFDVYGGDTYVNYYDHTKYDKNYPNLSGYPISDESLRARFARVYLAESPFNIDLRQGNHFNKNQADNGTGIYGDYIYNQVYSQQNNTRVFISQPLIDTTQEEFDTRIWYSKTKINGEQTDNWTFIDGYKDIESVYGPINRLEVLNDNLFAFQDRALANILVNPLSVIQDNNASNLVLGKATGVIQKHIYLTTEIGCKHQWSVVKSDSGIYWFDILGKRLCKLDLLSKGTPIVELSDAKGLFSYFQENLKGDINNIVHSNAYLVGDSPTYQYGITAGYDYRNKEAVFTFLDTNKQFTLAFSEVLGKFTSFYSFKPNMYIYTKDKFISADPENLNQLYLHNIDNTYGTFYTNEYDSDFSVITNKFPANTKVYDNLELFSEVTINNVDNGSSFNKVQCTTKYQDSGLLLLTPGVSIKRRERSWKLFVPRDTGTTGSSFQARLRDKYLITKLVFTNTGNKKLLLHWLKILFRASIS